MFENNKPKLGRLGRAWLTIITVTPLVIITSYELYQRLINGKEIKVLEQHDHIPIVRKPEEHN